MKSLRQMKTAMERRAALDASERLWPEASESPDVPSEASLVRYLEEGQARFRPKWLFDQIEESVACQRALEDLRLRRQLPPSRALERFFDKYGIKPGSQGAIAEQENSHVPALREQPAEPIRIGDVRGTRGDVRVFVQDRLRPRQSFRPLPVFIVPCTPAEAWPEELFADDELLLRTSAGDYVAHLHAEHPITVRQIGGKLAELQAPSLEALLVGRAPFAEGLAFGPEPEEETARLICGVKLDPAEDAWALLKRVQLQNCATWLSATLDAFIAFDRWQQSAFRQPTQEDRTALSETKVYDHLGLVATTGRTPASRCLVWPGPLASFHDVIQQGAIAETETAFWAECSTLPEPQKEDAALCRASWSIQGQQSDLAGKPFAVYCPSSARLVGNGAIQLQGEGLPLLAKLETGLWKDFANRKVENLILLIPKKW